MKKYFPMFMALASLPALAACHSQSQSPADNSTITSSPPATSDTGSSSASQSGAAGQNPDNAQQIVATVRGHNVVITQDELLPPLLKAYGLNILIREVQLDLAKEEARTRGIVISDADVANERKQTLQLLRQSAEEQQNPNALPSTQPAEDPSQMTDAEAEDLLQRVLAYQHVTLAEFNLTMETNAYLRKIVAPQLAGKITDDEVRQSFNAMYGEKARVRLIACANMQQAQLVLIRLKHGDDFPELARNFSADSISSSIGGEVPPFTRQDPRYSETFKDAVFGLQAGQISSIIHEGNFYDIVKLEALIPPSIVKFDDYKDEIRQRMYDQATRELMQQFSNQLGAEARQAMVIKDPILAKQYADILAQSQHADLSPDAQKRRWDASHGAPATMPDMGVPATQP